MSTTSDPRVSVAVDAKALLGESPHYDPVTNEVVWVDCDGKNINFFNCSTNSNRKLQLEKKVAIAIPCRSSGSNLVALCEKNICLIDRHTGHTKELCSVEPDKPSNRFNDGKCDALGRLWFGTLYPAPSEDIFTNKKPLSYGGFYSFDGVSIKQHLYETGISNGLDWSVDGNRLYFIDSIPKKVYSFDFDLERESISNQCVIIDYLSDTKLGLPDGMCRDSDGKLWIAGMFGGNVTRWDPVNGEKLMQIKLPVAKPTACCFGGPNYDVLYVTSGIFGAGTDELKEYPLSGALFAITGLGVKGLPANTFDDTKCH